MPKSRKAQSIRRAQEFDLSKLSRVLLPPRSDTAAYSWSVSAIADARDMQARGQFYLPAKLARKLREDDALYTAWQVRMSPEAAIDVALEAAPGARGASIANEGDALFGEHGIGLRPGTRQDVLNDLVNHGLAIMMCELKPRDDGSRVDIIITHWPIEHVRYDEIKRTLVTRLDASQGSYEIPITHGDGTWIVIAKTTSDPWTKHAALLPAALIWSTHAFAIRDWASASYAHGNAKIAGELPEGFAFFDSEGSLTDQAAAFYEIIKGAASSESLAAIIPSGAKITALSNPNTAHQIWSDIVLNRERAAQRVYCGTDASLGSPGGAPGVDILSLFGVSNTIAEGDLNAIARGVQCAIDVWCAINFGDSTLAPRFGYVIPNADAQAEREAYSTRLTSALDAIDRMHAAGLDVTPEYLEELRDLYDVSLPALVESAAAPSGLTADRLGVDILGTVVKVNEARAAAGLPALTLADGTPDPRGNMTIKAYADATASDPAATTSAAPTAIEAADVTSPAASEQPPP